jgi:hypothetical protein
MYGWMPQLYAKVPAWSNVLEYVAPLLSTGDSESLNLTVWLAGPGWVHVTVSPFCIVIWSGWNLKSLINTCAVFALATPVNKATATASMIIAMSFVRPPLKFKTVKR